MLPLPNYTSFTTSSVIIQHVCSISFVAAGPDYFCLACAYQIEKKQKKKPKVLLLVCDYTMPLTSGCIDPSSSIVLGVYILYIKAFRFLLSVVFGGYLHLVLFWEVTAALIYARLHGCTGSSHPEQNHTANPNCTLTVDDNGPGRNQA